jgi:uncharacterized spore protein YtfJ
MEDVGKLFDKAVTEIERMLNTKTVVGDPIKIDDTTLIPLVSVGFGFGVGGGEGTEPQKGSGHGGGTGGGGGVRPIAVVVISGGQVRVESVKSGTTSVLEKVAELIGKAATAKTEKNSD